jgi:hypothetical protein
MNSAAILILLLNAQSIVSKIDELYCTVTNLSPDIVLITESWCNDYVTNALLTMPGYDIVPDLRVDRRDTVGGIGGGLLVYAKHGMRILPFDTQSDFVQHVGFTVETGSESFNVVLVYRPPRIVSLFVRTN